MRFRRLLILLAMLGHDSRLLAADLAPTATLTLLPATVLPGLPVAMLISISNPTDQTKLVTSAIRLRVTREHDQFDAIAVGATPFAQLPADQLQKCNAGLCLALPPGAQREVYVRFGPWLVENTFFADRRLSLPGRYAVEIVLNVLIPQSSDATEVHTGARELTVSTPAGDDAEVWQLLQQRSGGQGWGTMDWINDGPSVAATILSSYPNSAYAPWVSAIGKMPATEAALARLDKALSMAPADSLRDELLLTRGELLAGRSRAAAFADRDADKSVALADQARATLANLRDIGSTAYIRSLAAESLSKLYTRQTADAEVRFLASADAPAPLPLVPHVECVQRGDGKTFSARFSYTNPNRVLKVVQIGPMNQVTPAPRDQGQPRAFEPGDHRGVFTASSPGGELKWHLDRSEATATTDFAVQCAAP